jgi:hypothetical protein
MVTPALEDRLRGLVQAGRTVEVSSRWPVSESAVISWADVMRFPLREHGVRPMLAPRPMLYCWTLPGLGKAGDRELTGKEVARELLAQHGYDAVVATDIEQEYYADLFVGQRVIESTSLESVSALKSTRLGQGFFLKTIHRFRDESGREVGAQRVGGFFYRPGRATDGPGAAAGRTAGAGGWSPEQIRVSTTDVVVGAMATNDVEPVHHDAELARSQGLGDIIMNVLTSLGLVASYATRRLDSDSLRLRRLRLALLAPVYPRCELTLLNPSLGHQADEVEAHVTGESPAGRHFESTLNFCSG